MEKLKIFMEDTASNKITLFISTLIKIECFFVKNHS